MNAQVTISRTSGGSGVRPIRIYVYDQLSGTQIIEVEMSLENFAKAVTGMGYADAEHDMTPEFAQRLACVLGKKDLAESVQVEFDCYSGDRNQREVDAQSVAEIVKNEIGCDSTHWQDLLNGHRTVKRGVQAMTVWFYDEVTEEGK